MIRVLHTADWHADGEPKKLVKLEQSLKQMLNYVERNKVNAIIHAGDIWERKQTYADKSGVPLVIEYLKEMSKHVDFIFITKGNNSHDEPGSISLLHQLEPNIYAYEYPVVLAVKEPEVPENGKVKDILNNKGGMYPVDIDYIVSLVPYPTKAMFVKEQSIDLNNDEFVSIFEGIFDLIADKTAMYNCPKLLAFHGNVIGSRLSTGQTLLSQDIMVAPATLKKAKADYYALGHIHLRQEVQPNMVYSGSIYNKNWGETEQKSFEVIEFHNWQEKSGELEGRLSFERVMLTSARPMITVEAEFMPELQGYFIIQTLLNEFPQNAEYRFRCKVKENERKLITDEVISLIKQRFGEDVKIEWNIIPDERESRSVAIMHAKTLLEEIEEYAKVVGFELSNSIKEKVKNLQSTKEEVVI